MSEKVKIDLTGRIDSNNAATVEVELFSQLEGKDSAPVELNAEKLDYISSAGLRVLLRIRKNHPEMSIINASAEIYDILDMTGFTEMMNVQRAYRVVSIDGCEEIGRGANGRIYRIDQDNVVKVYNNADALEDIKHEREVAKLALVLGLDYGKLPPVLHQDRSGKCPVLCFRQFPDAGALVIGCKRVLRSQFPGRCRNPQRIEAAGEVRT